MAKPQFNDGDKVEVGRDDGVSRLSSWHPATVLHSRKRQIHVQYQAPTSNHSDHGSTKRLKERVNAHNVRPAPPPELHRCFKVDDVVDAYHADAWNRGTIVGILEDSRYLVAFDGPDVKNREIEFEQWGLRVHRQWVDGSWVPPLEEQKSKGTMLKIKCNGTIYIARYSKGSEVEVRTEDEGYKGSMYTAVVIGSIVNGKALVEYQTLNTDDESELLKEEVSNSCIRPLPPPIKRVNRYKQFEEVDVWYNEGWWVGLVSRVLHDFQYLVYFCTTNELLEFKHSDLRPHQEWINGKWVTGSRRRSSELEVKSKDMKIKIKCSGGTSKAWLVKGAAVEVKSNEEGYQGSWYTAIIVGPVGNYIFLVEYQTLKTDDEAENLKEKAHALRIRPCPPVIHRVDRFEPLEEVDAWYNDGWWTGLISKVLDDLNYLVYFGNTTEELEFVHSSLRPHQEWTGRKWVVPSERRSSELLKLGDLILKRYYSGRTLEASFSKGMMVEVRSNEEGYQGSWYTAIVRGLRGNGKFLVEYQTLTTDDETKSLEEEVNAKNMRPCPPKIGQFTCYKLHEEVDAWYNEGWWIGLISKVLDGLKYVVYFKTTNEEFEFEHAYLRPHQRWSCGNWVASSMV